jgi:PAS domain S-box-containing protein
MKDSLPCVEWAQLEWLPGLLFIVDEDSVIRHANLHALNFLAAAEKDLPGIKLETFYQYPEDWAAMMKQLKEQSSLSDFEVIYRSSRGERLVAIENIREVKLKEDGKNRILIVGRDITRRLQVENELMNTNLELLQLNTRLQDMQKQLVQEKNMSSLGTMAAGIAHEMNNPLGFVKSNHDVLRDYIGELRAYIGELEETTGPGCAGQVGELREKHDIRNILEDLPHIGEEIDRGIRRVLDIVKSLDLFASPEPSGAKAVSIVEAMEKALFLTRSKRASNLMLRVELNEVPEVSVSMQELVQSFLNILINAYEAAGRDSSEKGPFVRISSRADENWVYCEVENSGPPIDETHIPRLFDPFFTTKSVGQGPGLGLTSVYHTVVLKYNGHVDVRSDDSGTCFTVRLPIEGEKS